ncbi:MAG: hypothetical protein GQ557_01700 [Mycoplasmataceae bacterium]|nr:hypothetical protein [Mycoplasmataceae bacterium]
MNKDELSEISMMIITFSGVAKSSALMAIEQAEESKYIEAKLTLETARENLKKASSWHFKALSEDNKNGLNLDVLFVHAEDQFLTSENILILSEKIIKIYERLEQKEEKNGR